MIEQRQVFGIVLLPPEAIGPSVRKVAAYMDVFLPQLGD